MIPVGTHGLNCPDGEDYAAIALYMQCVSDTLDSQLQTQLTTAQGFSTQPTIIAFPNAVKSVPASGSAADVFTTVTFNNSTFMDLVLEPANARNYIRIGSPVGVIPAVPYPRGLYMVGVCMSQTAAGAVTAYSRREVQVDVVDQSSPLTNQTIYTINDTTYETSTGGVERQLVKFPIYLTGSVGVQVRAIAINSNIPSAVNVATNALFWVTYVGPADLVEVA